MRYLTLGVAFLFSVNLFATPGMPKQARFLFNPGESETIVNFDELDLSAFKVTKCLDMIDVKTMKQTTSLSTALSYSGRSMVVTVGKQQYELIPDSGLFTFNSVGCVLDMNQISSIELNFRNTRFSENVMAVHFDFRPKQYKDLVSLITAGSTFRGKTLAYY